MKRFFLMGAMALCLGTFATVSAMPVPQDDNTQTQTRQKGRRGGQMNSEEMVTKRVENMTKKYNLTEAQATSLKTLFTEQMKNFQPGNSGERPSREKMEASRTEFENKIKAILTADQYTAYQKDESSMRQRMQQRERPQRQQDNDDMGGDDFNE